MTHHQLVTIARQECAMAGLRQRGLVAIDLGAGWMIIHHTDAPSWLVVL